MRAIWFILKLPLKILMAPVILSLTLFVWICVGIVYVSVLQGVSNQNCHTQQGNHHADKPQHQTGDRKSVV